MPDIILLEDEPVLRHELGEFLQQQGYAPTCVAGIAEFDRQFDAGRHRLAIIDIGLPDGDGLQLIRRLRQRGQRLGIIVFSARSTGADKVSGLDIGADYYLGKGCDLDELAATLSALVRRLGLRERRTRWRLDLGPRRLQAPNALQVALSQQDAVVLRCLMSHSGGNVSRQQIVQALGEDYLTYDQQRLDTQMSRLRRKVMDATGLELPIKTVRNRGYSFYAVADVDA